MRDPRVEVSLGEGLRGPGSEAWREIVSRAAATTLDAQAAEDAELSVTLLDDHGMAALNRQWLAREGPTDVIAFPLHGEGEPPVGDIYIGMEQARRQAEELHVPAEEELGRLVVHGTLHVLGWDHPEGEEREASEMWRVQEEIVRELSGGGERGD